MIEPESDHQSPVSGSRRDRRRWWLVLGLGLVVLLSAATWHLARSDSAPAPGAPGKGARGANGQNAPTPVAAQLATIQPKFEVTLTALGTVTARSTVTVHVQVDGQLVQVAFREGQMVHAGDLLAVVDPRTYQVALDNAQATLEKDRATLANAMVDLDRYKSLLADDSIPKQQYDTQVALVQQDKAQVLADQAQVDSAKLQLSFTHVTALVSGRVGLRQVDVGNVVHASDTGGLVLLTQVEPIDVVFPIPQDQLPVIRRRLATRDRMQVDAYGSDGRTLLATGALMTTDNQVDPTTGTVKLKAEFANHDGALFPNQFVNVRLHVSQIDDALTVPTAAVQRGAPGLYAYVVQADNKVQLRPLKVGPTDGDRVQVLDGLAANERVVVDGVDKLRDGAPVEVIDASARNPGANRTPRSGKPADAGSRKNPSATPSAGS